MKREDISDAMTHIGDDLIEEADAVRGTGDVRRNHWKGWAALAACAGVVLFGAVRWGSSPAEPAPTPAVETTAPLESTAPVETSPPTDTPVPTVDGLPMLTIELGETGMGFEGYMAYDISELVSGNPWTEEAGLTTLPVYANPLELDAYGQPVEDRDAMEAALREVADRLGMEGAEIEETDWGTLVIRGEGLTLDVSSTLPVTLEFEPTHALPEGYNFGYHAPHDAMAAAGEYLMETWAALLDMETPTLSLWGGDYNIYREQGYQIEVYEGAGDLTEQLVGYHFRRVAFYPDEEGRLWMVRFYLADLSQKLGDYPIITVDEAETLLGEGRYITSVPYELPGLEYVEKVELVYRNGTLEGCWMPYYRFYVRLPEEAEEDGLQTFGAYYVPAVEGRFLTNLPVWDGSFDT